MTAKNELTPEEIIGVFDEERHFKNGLFNFVEFGRDVIAKANQHYGSLVSELSEKLSEIEKKLDDREADLVEAKREERERIFEAMDKADISSQLNVFQKGLYKELRSGKP